MKFIIIHNRYSRPGGEEQVVAAQCELLRRKGHQVTLYERDYHETDRWFGGHLTGSLAALYNPWAVSDLRRVVRQQRPDVAIVHNLFPVISGAVLPMLKGEGVRIMMTLHNYRLVCPNGLFFTHGQICERCGQHALGPLNCLLHRCQGSMAESTAFALRGLWAGRWANYFKYVDLFMPLSEFQRNKLQLYGFDGRWFKIIPNMIEPVLMPVSKAVQQDYVGFVGRLSPEKGVDLLMHTARQMPHLKFKVAGTGSEVSFDLPPNVELMGFLDRHQLADFYTGARMIILTSRCYDNFPLSVIEAMYYGRAVVVPRLAALPEIVDQGRCGLLFETPEQLQKHIQTLWGDPVQAYELGACGQNRVAACYNSEVYYQNLMAATEKVMGLSVK